MTKKRIFTILFYMYIVFLIFVIVLKFDGSFEKVISLHHSITENEQSKIKNINVIPFRSILPYLRNITEPYAFKNIMGNILPFLPLGFFISNKFSKKVIAVAQGLSVYAVFAFICILRAYYQRSPFRFYTILHRFRLSVNMQMNRIRCCLRMPHNTSVFRCRLCSNHNTVPMIRLALK